MRIITGLRAVLLSCLALPSSAFADPVYAADLSFSGVAITDGFLGKQKIASDAILNVARGRAPDAAVPANEVLALVVDCTTGDASLVVFDVDLDSVLVTMATSGEEDLLLAPNGGAFGLEFDVADTGNASNGLDGGFLVVTGLFQPGPGGCPAGIKATAGGVLDVTITDDVGTRSLTAVLLKAKASFSSAPIAQLP